MKLKDAPWKESYDKPRQCIKSRDITLPTKVRAVKAMVFPVVLYYLWELNHKEGWAPRNWCFQTVGLEKTLQSPLDSKEIKPGNSKGNQLWMFIGRTVAETKAPINWPPDVKSWLTGKDPDAWKDWRQKEKREAEDEMVSMTDSMDMNLNKLYEIVKDWEAWHAAVHGIPKSRTNWVTEQQRYEKGFPGGSGGKESACSAGDLGSIPGL